jgi:protease-4
MSMGSRLLPVFLLLSVILNGCTLFNVNIVPSLKPLKEKVIEGAGESKLLLVDISGFISEKEPGGIREQPSLVAHVKEILAKAEQDNDIAGVILRINSPGGTVTASDTLYHEIQQFESRRKVPVYACITGLGTSGAYYIAAASDLIIAHPAAVTGSIGVMLLNFNVEGLLDKVGITEMTIKSGAKKDIMSPFRPGTAEEQKIMQDIIDSFAARFRGVVLARKNNRLSAKELEELADGRIYSANQALAAGLIDKVAYLDEAINELKEALGIKEAKVVTYYRPGGFKGSIYSSASPGSPSAFNLINIDTGGLDMFASPQFLYMWRP